MNKVELATGVAATVTTAAVAAAIPIRITAIRVAGNVRRNRARLDLVDNVSSLGQLRQLELRGL